MSPEAKRDRMMEAMRREIDHMAHVEEADSDFVKIAIDFLRTYADRCHQGKEEDILFRELRKKTLSQEHASMIADLEEDHRLERETTEELAKARERYLKGEKEALSAMADSMRFLTELYARHIEKEDKHFFFPVMGYFTDGEKQAMLEKGVELDSKLIHEKYKGIVNGL